MTAQPKASVYDIFDKGQALETVTRLVRELNRAETHLRRIYHASDKPGIVEGEVSAALAALAVARSDLDLPKHPEDTTE